MSDLNYHRCLGFHFSVFILLLVSIWKIYKTLKTVFNHIFKHLEVRQKYSAARRNVVKYSRSLLYTERI